VETRHPLLRKVVGGYYLRFPLGIQDSTVPLIFPYMVKLRKSSILRHHEEGGGVSIICIFFYFSKSEVWGVYPFPSIRSRELDTLDLYFVK
jgi:hypothetical protein